jgi:DNA polymerase III subunit beta
VDPVPRFPVLGGVLLDVGANALTVVATDRYRLAVASAPVRTLDGPATPAVVPAAFAGALLGLDGPGEVALTVDGTTVTATAGTSRESAELIDEPFPDYARLLPAGVDRMGADAVRAGVRVEIGAAELRAAVAAGGTRTVHRAEDGVDTPVTVLAADGDGRLAVGADLPHGVGVNAEFLLEAVAAAGGDQLVLHLDDLLNPILLRPVAADTFSLLMPVRL